MGAFDKEDMVDEDSGFIIEQLREPLVQYCLHPAVRVIQYGIPPSHFHFFAMLERSN